MDDECPMHHEAFAPRVHPDFHNKGGKTSPDNHKRGVDHPKHHTKGRLPSQINPDHGMHRGAGKHV